MQFPYCHFNNILWIKGWYNLYILTIPVRKPYLRVVISPLFFCLVCNFQTCCKFLLMSIRILTFFIPLKRVAGIVCFPFLILLHTVSDLMALFFHLDFLWFAKNWLAYTANSQLVCWDFKGFGGFLSGTAMHWTFTFIMTSSSIGHFSI